MDWSIKVCIITATTKLCEGIYTPCSLLDGFAKQVNAILYSTKNNSTCACVCPHVPKG